MKKNETVIYVDQESERVILGCFRDTQEVFNYFKNKKSNLNYRFIIKNKENDNRNQFKINVDGSIFNIFFIFNLDKGIFEKNISFDIRDIFVKENKIYIEREIFEEIQSLETILNLALKFIVLEQQKKYLFKKSENFIEQNNKKLAWIDNSNVKELDKKEVMELYFFKFDEEMKLKKKEYELKELIMTEEVLDAILAKVTIEELKSQPLHLPFCQFTYVMQDNIKLQCNYTENEFLKIVMYSKYDKHLATIVYKTSDNSSILKITHRFRNYFKSLFGNSDKAENDIVGEILVGFFYFLYFLNNYHVNKFKTFFNFAVDSHDKEGFDESAKRSVSAKEKVCIAIPRKRYICTLDDVKSSRKSSKPIYSVKEWPRSGHYREIRDKETGAIKKRVYIEAQTCKRRKGNPEGGQKCKKTYLMEDVFDVENAVLS